MSLPWPQPGAGHQVTSKPQRQSGQSTARALQHRLPKGLVLFFSQKEG